MSEIAEAAFQYQTALEKGDKQIVGVNTHPDSVTGELEIMRVSHEVETEQVAELVRRKAGRDEAAVTRSADGDGGGVAAPTPTWCRRCSTPYAPRRRSARSATPCAPSGASTASPPGSEPLARPATCARIGPMSAEQFSRPGAIDLSALRPPAGAWSGRPRPGRGAGGRRPGRRTRSTPPSRASRPTWSSRRCPTRWCWRCGRRAHRPAARPSTCSAGSPTAYGGRLAWPGSTSTPARSWRRPCRCGRCRTCSPCCAASRCRCSRAASTRSRPARPSTRSSRPRWPTASPDRRRRRPEPPSPSRRPPTRRGRAGRRPALRRGRRRPGGGRLRRRRGGVPARWSRPAPGDAEAAARLAQAQLMQRTDGVDADGGAGRGRRASRPTSTPSCWPPTWTLLGGHVGEAFDRVIALVPQIFGDDRERARRHLLGLFDAVGQRRPPGDGCSP